MKNLRITTQRLELLAATEEIVQAEINDCDVFASIVQAQIPATWPPLYNDLETQTFALQKLQNNPAEIGWWSWYFVLKGASPEERVLIGLGGFKGLIDENGKVEVGYSVVEEFQRQGYASEAVAGLISWAHEQGAKTIEAETLSELKASIRVLEKNGFSYEGESSEEGVILYRKDLRGLSALSK